MKNRLGLLLVTLVFATCAIVGCGAPSPEKVCSHATKIMTKAAAQAKRETNAKQLEALTEQCVKQLEKEKERQPAQYKCQASCIMEAIDLDGMSGCTSKCSDLKDKSREPDPPPAT